MTDSIRLAKRLAEQIACSRSEAEQYIQGGWVQVDGETVEEPGVRVVAQQKVTILAEATLAPVAPITILLHKRAGEDLEHALRNISADTHVLDDRSGIRFLKRHLLDAAPTSTLETQASGLLVLSQDWRIRRKLVDDAQKIECEYIVDVEGSLTPEELALLNHGMVFNGKPLPPVKVSWQNETRLRFALKNAQLGQITHMCEKVGLKVKALRRIRIGRVSMASLQPGMWRYLLGYERF